MKRLIVYLSFGLLCLPICTCQAERVGNIDYEWGLSMFGDSLAWASPDYSDEHWRWQLYDVKADTVFWMRLWVTFQDIGRPYQNYGTITVATANYDMYWDGHYMGTNRPSHAPGEAESPGAYNTYFSIPDSLAQAGRHLVALRCRSDGSDPTPHGYVMIDKYLELARGPLQVSKYMFLLAGCFLLTSIYFLFLFLMDRRQHALLVFSIINVVFAALLLMEYLKLFYLYPYTFQMTRLQIIGYLHLSLTFLIPIFFVLLFRFPWWIYLFGGLGSVVLVLEYNYHCEFDWIARQHTALLWLSSLIIVVYALWQRKAGAWPALASLLLGFVVVRFFDFIDVPYVATYDVTIFLAFVLLILAMVYLLVKQRQRIKLAYEASMLRAEQLKVSLLKKQIRPHFLLNTLTSLIDWVEESPRQGVVFIEALAEEFKVLNHIADQELIPIRQEIQLCQNHLKVMSYRKEIDYQWEEEGIVDDLRIPPAIIHTAVENGVTHGRAQHGKIRFVLRYQPLVNGHCYTLETIAKIPQANNRPVRAAESGGTGLRYIRSRLQECYGDQWDLQSQPSARGWEVIIKIFTV